MSDAYADVLGPLYAWTQALPTVPGVDYTGDVQASVQMIRPDGEIGPTWTVAGGSIALTNRTATTCTLRHVYASDITEVPFITRDSNPAFCVYRFFVEVFVDGVFVHRETVCRKLRNPRHANPC